MNFKRIQQVHLPRCLNPLFAPLLKLLAIKMFE